MNLFTVAVKDRVQRKDEPDETCANRRNIENALSDLVARASAAGFRVTIENVSDQPPAMRNYHPAIHVYDARGEK